MTDRNGVTIPDMYAPISPWAYFGLTLLYNVPVIGFIFAIVFSCGASRNRNVRNFSRSFFCYYVIIAIVLLILLFTGGLIAIISNLS